MKALLLGSMLGSVLIAFGDPTFSHPVQVSPQDQPRDPRVTQEMEVLAFLDAVESEEVGEDPGKAREFLTGATDLQLSPETADAITKYALKRIYLRDEISRAYKTDLCQRRAEFLVSPDALAARYEASSREQVEFRKALVTGFLDLLTDDEKAVIFGWIDKHMRISLIRTASPNDIAAKIRSGELSPAQIMARQCPE